MTTQSGRQDGTNENSEEERDQNNTQEKVGENGKINPQSIDASSSDDEQILLPGSYQNRLTRQRIDGRPQRIARVPRRFDDFVTSNIIFEPEDIAILQLKKNTYDVIYKKMIIKIYKK